MINSFINEDCFNVFPKIEDNSIDLVLVDLPYGQTSCEWDVEIDLQLMWQNLKRICRDNCQYLFFTTVKFGNKLINSNPSWFRYDLVWEKFNAVGFLCANKMPLRSHEMIYVFNSSSTNDISLTRNMKMRAYAKKVKEYINRTLLQINTDFGNRTAEHFIRYGDTQFSIPTKETYTKLIELYEINKMDGYLTYNELVFEKIRYTYNPQKTPGKPYKIKAYISRKDVYGQEQIPEHENKSGDRHPRSVMKYHQSDEKLHPTQKPSNLCEYLIKTYSNENDVVLDFCAGSGSSIIGCIKSNRNYIGIEKNEDIFDIAKERIEKNLFKEIII